MKYREDPDLDFLKDCSSAELNVIVEVLLHDKKGQQRSIVQLPNHPLYKQHAPDHALYWSVIAGEVQRYGSNPLAALARAGRGKHYMKILEDVCGRFGIRYIPGASVEVIERELYMTLLNKALASMSTTNLQLFAEKMGIHPETMTSPGILESLSEKMRLDDTPSSQIAMLIAHGAARHASTAGYEEITSDILRPLLEIFAAPVSAELEHISPLSLTGSAHWIVIPTVLQIAYLRAKKNVEKLDSF